MLTFRNHSRSEGFSLLETALAVTIITTIAAIAIPGYTECINNAKIVRAIGDIKYIQSEIDQFHLANNALPDSLEDLKMENTTDPWGNPYQYLAIAGAKSRGDCRKDKFLVPLNTDYDLYSMGRDGSSVPPLTAKPSRDDIVRASNGSFIGLAVNY